MFRTALRSSLPIFGLLYAFIACSSKDNDFFGSTAGTSGSAGNGGSAVGGAGGNTSPTSGSGGNTSSTGGDGNGGSGLATNGGTGATAGAGASGGASAVGGTGGASATSGTGGTDETGGDGGDDGGMGNAGMPDAGGTGGTGAATGGAAAGGSAGTAGDGAGGTVGGTGGSGGATGGTGGKPGKGCHDNDECDNGTYCKKESCSSAEGTCVQQPESCVGDNAVFDPVCGCDRMTYYTPCVAAREGVNVETAGECTGDDQAPCNREDGGASCEPQRNGARCYRPRVGCEGLSSSTGVCWVLPDQCPPNEPTNNTYCGGSSGDPECVGLCAILDEDMAVYRDSPACSD
jgi:hypothetical protein